MSAIDANQTVAGNQSFVFGTSQEAGHLWAHESGRFTWIYGNTDNDPDPEITIGIRDEDVPASAYAADDFIL